MTVPLRGGFAAVGLRFPEGVASAAPFGKRDAVCDSARRSPRPPGGTVATNFYARLVGLAPALSLMIGAALGEDRVTVQRRGSQGTMTITGRIEDVTARRLTLLMQDEKVRRSFPIEEVVAIETHRSTAHRQGLDAFAAGKYAEAESLLASAIDQDVRKWVQQDLYADLIRCSVRRGNRGDAGAYFGRMLEQEPTSRYWNVSPLIWGAEEIDGELRRSAVEWLASPEEGVRLLGASILLLDEKQSDAAQRALDDLSRHPDLHVSALARAQSWRLRLAAGDLSAVELQSWRQSASSMPASIRGGPMYVVGRASAARSNLEQAAADWLWLPLVYDDDASLAARACVDAGDALSRLGRGDEAARLYQEAIDRFGWSPAAGDARQRIKSHSGKGDGDGG